MRFVFMGSPPFGTAVFERLLDSEHTCAALVTRPDRPRGRGRSVRPSPIVELARERGVDVLQPQNTRGEDFLATLRGYEPDVLMVASYGEILRQPILELAPHGALNVHASLLPRWRGAAPIQRAILAGDEVTGVAVQRIVLALDEGDVLLTRETKIGAEESSGELFERLAALGGEAAVAALDLLASGAAEFTPQPTEGVTYAKKLAKADGRIDWSRPAPELARFVRAMTPWPGARTSLPDGRELVVLAARAVGTDPTDREPGALVDAKASFQVATGDGVLELGRVKAQGKKPVDGADFLRGARLDTDTRLGGDEDAA